MSDIADFLIQALGWYPVVEALPYFFIVYVCQATRIVKRKSSGDLSLVTYIGLFCLNAMWTLYGVFYCEWPYVFSCIVNAVGIAIVTGLIFFYRNGKTAEPASGDAGAENPSTTSNELA